MNNLKIVNKEFGYYDELILNIVDGIGIVMDKFNEWLDDINKEIIEITEKIEIEKEFSKDKDSKYFISSYKHHISEVKKRRNRIKISLGYNEEIGDELIWKELFSMSYRKYIMLKNNDIKIN